MRYVLAVDPIWLTELAPFFFGLKESKWDRKFEKDLKEKIEREHQIKLNLEEKQKKKEKLEQN